jgi:hypothetical protein
VRLHAQGAPSGQHRPAARRATFGALVGNLFGATCVLPRARHAELELDPLVVVSADGRRRIAVVAVVYRCDFVTCVEQARRVQASGAAGLILVNEHEGQAPPDWRPANLRGSMQRKLRAAWSPVWSREHDGFPGEHACCNCSCSCRMRWIGISAVNCGEYFLTNDCARVRARVRVHTGDISIPVFGVDPADGELLARAILRAEAYNNPDSSRYGAQSFVRDMLLSAVGESSGRGDAEEAERAGVAKVDMLEIPPKLR